jgi:hypothetical protein
MPQWHRRQAARIAGARSAPAVALHCTDSVRKTKPRHFVHASVTPSLISQLCSLTEHGQDVVRITLTFKVECPTGSGNYMTLFEVAKEIARRNTSMFLRDANGQRPVYRGTRKFQDDPHWRDYILYYEYFHGDNGAALGASHQTGWTGLVARAFDLFARLTPEAVLTISGKALAEMTREQVAGQRKG